MLIIKKVANRSINVKILLLFFQI